MKKSFQSSLREQSQSKRLVARELGFDGSKSRDSYKEYSPYYDVHMADYWMSPITRSRLRRVGILSRDGTKLLDPDKERMQLCSIHKQMVVAEDLHESLKRREFTELLVEAAWLKRALVQELKREDIH